MRGGAHQGLVREGKKILDGAAAAGNNNNVNLGEGIQLCDRLGDLADGVLSLDGDLTDLETGSGPTGAGVDDDIVLSLRISATHQADHAREERKGLLAICIKEAFCG